MEQLRKVGFVAVGIGDLAVEKTRELIDAVRSTKSRQVAGAYESLSTRGRGIVQGIRRSKPVKRATTQTSNAARQLKGAATSVKKGVGVETKKAG